MKRFLLMLVPIAIVAGVAPAAQKALSPEVRATLEKAVINEREAAERYQAFAVTADAEGYPGAAALFRAQAKAETIHAKRFGQLLKNAGVAIPAAVPTKPESGSTENNLRAAATAEMGERDGFYRTAVDSCRQSGDAVTAKVFDETRDAEVEHANLDAAAARNLDDMKKSHTYYVCGRCGYATDVRLPLCPSCRHRELESFD